jgi:hypothetical protein
MVMEIAVGTKLPRRAAEIDKSKGEKKAAETRPRLRTNAFRYLFLLYVLATRMGSWRGKDHITRPIVPIDSTQISSVV